VNTGPDAFPAAYVAVLDLLNRFTDTVNRRDWPALQALFCEDGVWDVGGPDAGAYASYFEGAAAVAAGIESLVSTFEFLVQTNHAPVIEISGRRAAARSTIHEFMRPAGGGGITVLGSYADEIVQEGDDRWRFKKRSFRFVYVDTTPLTGQVMARPQGGTLGCMA